MTVETLKFPCDKLYRAGDPRVRPVELAVVHWTASPPKAPGEADSARIRAWLANAAVQSSTHFVVMRDGTIIQAARLSERTWHAGGSTWTDPVGHLLTSINSRSIGIDLENVGPVRNAPTGSGKIDAYGGTYHGAPPEMAGRESYEPYTLPQLAAFYELAKSIAADLPILKDPARWVGHQSIQPGKIDPGPLFPWAGLASVLR